MRAVYAAFLPVALAAIPLGPSPADTDRTLENAKGTVTYGQSSPATTALALHARTQLADDDFADTGSNSLPTITKPDSSQVILAPHSSVQMKSFNETTIAHASFVVVGKVRLFQTTTGQIAVRGTEGDIFSSPQGLQVNVCEVSNPAFRVQVTLANGQVFTQSLFAPFQELGAPLSNKSSAPAPAPTATSVPITVSGRHPNPRSSPRV